MVPHDKNCACETTLVWLLCGNLCQREKFTSWVSPKKAHMNIGATIRTHRMQKGMSQGDIEKRTGLLRCYLSRVENGHTIPSLDTLSKIATAMEVPLAHFFADDTEARTNGKTAAYNDDDLRFLNQFRRYSANLNESDRKLLLAMVKKFAANASAK